MMHSIRWIHVEEAMDRRAVTVEPSEFAAILTLTYTYIPIHTFTYMYIYAHAHTFIYTYRWRKRWIGE